MLQAMQPTPACLPGKDTKRIWGSLQNHQKDWKTRIQASYLGLYPKSWFRIVSVRVPVLPLPSTRCSSLYCQSPSCGAGMLPLALWPLMTQNLILPQVIAAPEGVPVIPLSSYHWFLIPGLGQVPFIWQNLGPMAVPPGLGKQIIITAYIVLPISQALF